MLCAQSQALMGESIIVFSLYPCSLLPVMLWIWPAGQGGSWGQSTQAEKEPALARANHELIIPQHLQLAELIALGSGVFIY